MSDIPGIGILAGGKSRRMGQNKAFLPVEGEAMLERLLHKFRDYPEVTVSAAAAGLYEDCGRPVVYDEVQGIGPLEGICRILENTSRDHVFLCAVDMPFVTAELVTYLMKKVSCETDCVCLTEGGRIHPLCAVYSKSALSFLRRRKEEGCFRITELVQEMRTCFVPLEESGLPPNSAENINDPGDYRKLCGPFVFCVSGIKNSGKTGLIERLIPYFSADGLQVGVIKHDGHEFDIDHEGTDSDRFSRAGAAVSTIYSGTQYAVIAHRPPKTGELLSHCTGLDVVIIEGMKYSGWPKVEVLRKVNGNLPVCPPDTWICLASDFPLPDGYLETPQYDLDDTQEIYRCIRKYMQDQMKAGMKLQNHYQPAELLHPVKINRVYPNGERMEEDDLVITEHTLHLVFGDRRLAEIVCTPQELVELVVGHLFTEGLIGSLEDIEALALSEDGTVAEVQPTQKSMEPMITRPLPPHSFTTEDVFSAIEHFSAGSSMHRRTSGTHRCMLIGKHGEILVSCEDISRHNALDKVIGTALLQGLPLGELGLFTSGRVQLDMTSKVVFSGIPLLISKSVPTSQSIEMAERYGMTLITSAWPDNFRLVTGYLR